MDENLPFSKHTLDDLLGRTHTPEEYQYYFERNPHALLYIDLYSSFLNEPRTSRELISSDEQQVRELRGGYVNGKRPGSGEPSAGVLGSIFHSRDAHGTGVSDLLRSHTLEACERLGRLPK